MVSLLDISLKEWQDRNLEYLRYEYNFNPYDLVIDIGSYRREFADTITKKFGCKVECFDALDQRAAWIHDGTIELGGQFYYTSQYDTNNKQTFRCVDIAPYLDKEIALCKINIEGMEYVLLQYIISKGLIKNIKNLQVQFHLIDNEDTKLMYNVLAQQLRKTHSLTWQYPFCWENWKRND
jgi:hypothetical protein